MPVSRNRKPKNRKCRGIKPPKTNLVAMKRTVNEIMTDEPAERLIEALNREVLNALGTERENVPGRMFVEKYFGKGAIEKDPSRFASLIIRQKPPEIKFYIQDELYTMWSGH